MSSTFLLKRSLRSASSSPPSSLRTLSIRQPRSTRSISSTPRLQEVFENADSRLVKQEVFERKSNKPILLDFYADWCQPCRLQTPILKEMANDPDVGVDLITVNSDANQQLAQQLEIRALPTVFTYKKGKLVGQWVGLRKKGEVKQYLKDITA